MKRHDDEVLDADERALAAQLHRLPPHGEPTPELDARILAMARATPTAKPAPRRQPWPVYASAAVVCALTAGLAWQLWPAHVQRDDAVATHAPAPPAAKPVAAAPPPDTANAPAEIVTPEPEVDVAPSGKEASEARPPQSPRPAPVRIESTPQPSVSPPAEESAAHSTAATMSAAPAVAPPSSPAPPPPPAPASSTQMESTASTNAATTPADAAAKPRELKTTAPAASAMRTQSTADAENGYDARPPATVQDANVRNDWLKRIRELMTKGDRDGARASLQEYHARYPDATIPPDLQPLLAPPPAKSP